MVKVVSLVLLFLLSCSETFVKDSKEFEIDPDLKKFEISDSEAEAILEKMRKKVEAGEDLSGTLQALIIIANEKLSKKNKWQSGSVSNEIKAKLEEKIKTYKNLIPETLDPFGFIEGCDGLLFTSLLGVGGYPLRDLFQAESQSNPGKWFRSASQSCFQEGRAESTISRDMLLGLAVYLWFTQDRSAIERLISFAEENNFIMGEASSPDVLVGRALLSPSLTGLYYEMRFRLGGLDNRKRGYVPDFKPAAGFAAHLQVLSILLRGSLFGGIFKQDLKVLKELTKKNPGNALFQVVLAGFSDKSMDEAATILLDSKLFPDDRLPTNHDRCEGYIWQRDQNTKDWQPCVEEKLKSHSGVDFLFVSRLILGQLPIGNK